MPKCSFRPTDAVKPQLKVQTVLKVTCLEEIGLDTHRWHGHVKVGVEFVKRPANVAFEKALHRQVEHLVIAWIEDDARRVAVLEPHRLGRDYPNC